MNTIEKFIKILKSIKTNISLITTFNKSEYEGKKVQFLAQRVDGKKVPVNRKL